MESFFPLSTICQYQRVHFPSATESSNCARRNEPCFGVGVGEKKKENCSSSLQHNNGIFFRVGAANLPAFVKRLRQLRRRHLQTLTKKMHFQFTSRGRKVCWASNQVITTDASLTCSEMRAVKVKNW